MPVNLVITCGKMSFTSLKTSLGEIPALCDVTKGGSLTLGQPQSCVGRRDTGNTCGCVPPVKRQNTNYRRNPMKMLLYELV